MQDAAYGPFPFIDTLTAEPTNAGNDERANPDGRSASAVRSPRHTAVWRGVAAAALLTATVLVAGLLSFSWLASLPATTAAVADTATVGQSIPARVHMRF